MFTMTAGSSRAARKERPSCLRLMPGDEELVMARMPVAAAPRTMLMEAISLSPWRNTPPTSSMRLDMYSGISFWGVMG